MKMNNAPATCWAIMRKAHYYTGVIGAPGDSYVRHVDMIIAVADEAAAVRLAKAMQPKGCYYLEPGEYSPPSYEARRIKYDKERVLLVSEERACRLLWLDYDLEVAASS